jgi:hypothetical protein
VCVSNAVLYQFDSWFEKVSGKKTNSGEEIKAAIVICARVCKCGGTYIFVGSQTPFVCSACKNIVVPPFKIIDWIPSNPEEAKSAIGNVELPLLEFNEIVNLT